jgi:hypothetical protein
MTEAKWLACIDTTEMRCFVFSSGQGSYRQMRLYACACCRLIPDFLESTPDR